MKDIRSNLSSFRHTSRALFQVVKNSVELIVIYGLRQRDVLTATAVLLGVTP